MLGDYPVQTKICTKPAAWLLPWLTHQTSITEKLEAVVDNVRLQRLSQCWMTPTWWDKYMLSIGEARMIAREVIMWAGESPCWYARTTIPESTYQADIALFKRLDTEPLGHLIFQGNRVERQTSQYYPIDERCIEFHWIKDSMRLGADILWARITTLKLYDDHPFYLMEIFLPPLEAFSS